MFKKSMVALLAMALFAAPAMAADPVNDSGELPVNVTVASFVELDIPTGAALDVTVDSSKSVDLAQNPQRAEFSVVSNVPYAMEITSSNGTFAPNWVNATYNQVKFVNTEDSNVFMGGSLFLDTDLGLPPHTNGDYDNGLVRWNGANGNISATNLPAGAKTYGLGGEFNPAITGTQGVYAAPGTYTTNALITVTASN